MKKFFGLGRGLESLIPTKVRATTVAAKKEDVFYVETANVVPNAKQPRRDFEKSALVELADSIKKYGVLQPLLVSKIEEESDRGIDIKYQIIAGERRWRASQLAGVKHIPVIVKDNFDEDKIKLEVALVENLQREDLSALEEAEAYSRLANDFGMTQRDIAERVGRSREVVANTIRLLDLEPEIKESLRSGKISKTHARTLLAFKDKDERMSAFKAILTGDVRARHLESAAKELSTKGIKNKLQANNQKFMELESNLSKNLGTAVLIKNLTTGGRIEIKFADISHLNNIVKAILD